MPKIIRDPIHNIIEVEDDVVNLIDTYAFQRLRRIRQLGVAWLVYPSAEHSRYTHSLGVYGMSKRIIKALKENSKDFDLEKDEEKLIAIAALLHDIGHGPFSHAFESVIKNLGGSFDHEKMSIQIIKECEDIRAHLRRYGDNFADNVCQILNKEYPDNHVGSIISSQFDADRIDYLLRDSYMTGANYGKFDVDWLLKNISIKKATFPAVEGQTVVCINYNKGLNVLEQYILGRYYMYVHVYYHKVIRAFETIIYNIIKRVIKEEHNKLVGYKAIKALYSGNTGVDAYLKLDDFTVIGWFNEWYHETNDLILKDLLHHFFCRKPFYKVIHPSAKLNEYWEQKNEVLKKFDTEEQKEYFFYEDTPTNVAYKSLYYAKGASDEIFVCKNEKEIIPLSAVDDTIISQAGSTLNKDIIRWYIKSDRG